MTDRTRVTDGTSHGPITHRGPSLDFVWRIITPSLAFMIAALYPIVPNDFWWHARTGAIILAERAIPTADRFSFTRAGEPWMNASWASDIAIHALVSAGGPPVILLVHALMIAGGIAILGALIARHHGVRAASLATFAGAMVGAFDWNVRPQVASLLLFPILVSLVELDRRGQRSALAWSVPLFALWSNLHGGFVFGVLLLVAYATGQWHDARRRGWAMADARRARRVVIIAALAVLATSLNPAGPAGIVRYVSRFGTSELTLHRVTEFQPLVATTIDGMIFFAAIALLLAVLARARVTIPTDQKIALVVLALAALSAQRSAPWFGFVFVPPLARGIDACLGRSGDSRGVPGLNALLVAVLSGGALITMPLWRSATGPLAERCPLISRSTPVAAGRFACATLPAGSRGFQDQVFASYLVDACPELPVFTDTRVELFTAEIFDDYEAIATARWDWQLVADRWAMTYLLLSASRQPEMVRALAHSTEWRAVYRDEVAVLFTRVITTRRLERE